LLPRWSLEVCCGGVSGASQYPLAEAYEASTITLFGASQYPLVSLLVSPLAPFAGLCVTIATLHFLAFFYIPTLCALCVVSLATEYITVFFNLETVLCEMLTLQTKPIFKKSRFDYYSIVY
jgi:hypothetical protein